MLQPDTDLSLADPVLAESAELAGPARTAAIQPLSHSPRQPNSKFLLAHPAHCIALGFGSGLSPIAPGTAGTVWGWLSFLVLQRWLTPEGIGWLIALSVPLGWWACTVTAQNLRQIDPGCIVWDEIVAFWAVLWLVMPTGLLGQTIAFALFRYFDAAKPGPVGWTDRLSHRIDPATGRHVWSLAGLGIMADDLVAAGCTLLLVALWRFHQ